MGANSAARVHAIPSVGLTTLEAPVGNAARYAKKKHEFELTLKAKFCHTVNLATSRQEDNAFSETGLKIAAIRTFQIAKRIIKNTRVAFLNPEWLFLIPGTSI